MDDPILSPEAQEVINRLRALLSLLEKDLEEIRFKASYFELLRLHSTKHLSRNELSRTNPTTNLRAGPTFALPTPLPRGVSTPSRRHHHPHRISALDQSTL